MIITAQDLYNFTKCKHRVYLDSNGDPAERAEVSSFVKLLWEMGLQTEQDYLASLGEGEFENLTGLSIDQAAEKTLELMQAGAPLIYQGVLRHDDLSGRPDVLLKRDDAGSGFGDYYYEPVDIKAGRGWEVRDGKKTRFKEHYAFQILFYHKLLGELQGHLPPTGRIINVDREFEEFDPADFTISFESAFNEVRKLVNGKETSEPVLGSTCHQCQWYLRCRKWAEDRQDPTLLFFVGKNKFQLKEKGLTTVRDIARMDIATMLKPANKIPRLGKATLERMKQRAEVILAGRPLILPGYTFPRYSLEVYFDIEDDPTRDHTYLYGLVEVRDGGAGQYKYFLAERPDGEEQAVRAFWDYLANLEETVIYVYSHKERSSLKNLMEKYDLDPDVYDKYLGYEYDMYQDLVVKYSDWPTYSYGLKRIASLTGFSWRDEDPGGANSIAWYNDYLKDTSNQAVLQRILDYNEDDCRSMITVKRYFEERL